MVLLWNYLERREFVLSGFRLSIVVFLSVVFGVANVEAMNDPPGKEEGKKSPKKRSHKRKGDPRPEKLDQRAQPQRSLPRKEDLIDKLIRGIEEKWEKHHGEIVSFPVNQFKSSINNYPYTWGIFGSLISPEFVQFEYASHFQLRSIENLLLACPKPQLEEYVQLTRRGMKDLPELEVPVIPRLIHLMTILDKISNERTEHLERLFTLLKKIKCNKVRTEVWLELLECATNPNMMRPCFVTLLNSARSFLEFDLEKELEEKWSCLRSFLYCTNSALSFHGYFAQSFLNILRSLQSNHERRVFLKDLLDNARDPEQDREKYSETVWLMSIQPLLPENFNSYFDPYSRVTASSNFLKILLKNEGKRTKYVQKLWDYVYKTENSLVGMYILGFVADQVSNPDFSSECLEQALSKLDEIQDEEVSLIRLINLVKLFSRQ